MPISHTKVITEAAARSIVAEAEAAFMAADVPRILSLFTPDVVVRYADFPEMRGLDALEKFLQMRFARQKNYRLRKPFRAVTGNIIGGQGRDLGGDFQRLGIRWRSHYTAPMKGIFGGLHHQYDRV